MAKEGIKGTESIINHYKTICEWWSGDISAEVIATILYDIVGRRKKN